MRRCFPEFISCEKALKKAYRFLNPYRICKTFMQQRGEEQVDVYGETPLPVYAQIAKACTLSSSDTFVELGCGRGRGVFFLNTLTGCQAIGIDWVPHFIHIAEAIARGGSHGVFFQCEDLLNADLSKATAIYLYGTCLSEEEILSLIDRFKGLSQTVKIVTVSYPLSDYSSYFSTLQQFTARFPWGTTDVYLQQKNIY